MSGVLPSRSMMAIAPGDKCVNLFLRGKKKGKMKKKFLLRCSFDPDGV